MRIKICGITQPDQGTAIANLGVTTLGFICVAASPRYVTPQQIKEIIENIPKKIDFIGVFANASLADIQETVKATGLTGIQLHGNESPQFCQEIKDKLPNLEIIKAFRVKTPETLTEISAYSPYINTLLLDAYHPQQLGGTGKTIDWSILQSFTSSIPWLLAGGLTPDNVLTALETLHPDGIDLSSGVERSPGNKDLEKVQQLLKVLKLRF